MPRSEDAIRNLIASNKIRVSGRNVDADPSISPHPHATREENAAHIDMLRRAYHMYPRQDHNMPMPDPYIRTPDYVAGGSADRRREQEESIDQWSREMEAIQQTGFAPTRAMRALRDPELGPGGLAFENLRPGTYAKALGFREVDRPR
jgi:hypothetical protein